MTRKLLYTVIFAVTAISIKAADPTATHYPTSDCQGSLKPYPVPEVAYEYPDSLRPVHINHVGRHGARYPSGPAHTVNLRRALLHADSINTITPTGKKLLALTGYIIDTSHNRWGALDSLGMAEQRGIASRMFMNFPMLFNDGVINAISSYAPRCVMSMFSFTHQLDRLNNHVEIITSSGRQNSALMRPFDVNQDYLDFRKESNWAVPYNQFFTATAPSAPIRRVLGDGYPLSEPAAQELSLTEYYVIAGLSAMSVDCDVAEYFTDEEYNALWSCFNLRQYLQRTASTISTVPAEIAAPLLLDIINTADAVIDGTNPATVNLRFGHAETLMPLLSLMHLRGCYYMTNYFDTVGQHWKDFHVVPMAANLQIILFRSTRGKYYVRVDLNEIPVPLQPNDDTLYVPYDKAREYLMRCIPLYYQP